MNEDRPYWDMEIEPLLNTPEMEKIQPSNSMGNAGKFRKKPLQRSNI